MRTHSGQDTIYIGRNAGEEILQKLKGATREIKIVSPYLTASYIEELVALQKRGIKVTLITSDNLEQGDGNYSDLTHTDIIKQKRIVHERLKERRDTGVMWSAISYVLVLPFIFFSIYLAILSAILSTVALITFYTTKIYSYEYYSIFRLRVFNSYYGNRDLRERRGTHLVHSKVFVIDDRIAFVGSVNFTYSGMKNNYETAVKVEDRHAVHKISREVDDLFNSKSRNFKPISEWGRELYAEPRY